tara:strand:+ start:177 stop:521 length:345 start_codon:yes stop_codon:yes gene_type:complete
MADKSYLVTDHFNPYGTNVRSFLDVRVDGNNLCRIYYDPGPSGLVVKPFKNGTFYPSGEGSVQEDNHSLSSRLTEEQIGEIRPFIDSVPRNCLRFQISSDQGEKVENILDRLFA